MLRVTEIKLPLDHAVGEVRSAVLRRLQIGEGDLLELVVFKRSYDARKRGAIVLVYVVDVAVKDEKSLLKRFKKNAQVFEAPDMRYKPVVSLESPIQERPVVIGMGPCGMFAALLLAQMGLRPIVLERGKAVRDRSMDTFGFWVKGRLNPESNAQFGEGGAGTFSDGKLYSRVGDPQHYGRKVLEELVAAGANEEILYVNKPHIGTYRLVKIVQRMREEIVRLGGEVRFESRVVDVAILRGRGDANDRDAEGQGVMQGVHLASGEFLAARCVVLAVGHSARDTFEMLCDRGVYVEAKPFAVGFRVEHPQGLIDDCRFGPQAGHELLGAADYKLVHHCTNGRAVYSFCMCPGGKVVAAASEPGRLVTNGMSEYGRDESNANSAIVVGITPEDFPGSPLAGMALQRELEVRAFELGGGNYEAPGQLVGDFLAGRASTEFGTVVPSYRPGVKLGDLSGCLPGFAVEALREAIPAFEKQIRGFAMDDAVLTGVETRTSSPIRIKRDDGFQSLNTRGLFPAGEGAGYAGGILSAGIDGIRVAEAVARAML